MLNKSLREIASRRRDGRKSSLLDGWAVLSSVLLLMVMTGIWAILFKVATIGTVVSVSCRGGTAVRHVASVDVVMLLLLLLDTAARTDLEGLLMLTVDRFWRVTRVVFRHFFLYREVGLKGRSRSATIAARSQAVQDPKQRDGWTNRGVGLEQKKRRGKGLGRQKVISGQFWVESKHIGTYVKVREVRF